MSMKILIFGDFCPEIGTIWLDLGEFEVGDSMNSEWSDLDKLSARMENSRGEGTRKISFFYRKLIQYNRGVPQHDFSGLF